MKREGNYIYVSSISRSLNLRLSNLTVFMARFIRFIQGPFMEEDSEIVIKNPKIRPLCYVEWSSDLTWSILPIRI